MRLTVRGKLVLLSLLILVVVSFAFTLLLLRFTRDLVEEDFEERAVVFAREIAATIGDRQELENRALLDRQITQVIALRPNILQLDILAFAGDASRVVATSQPRTRLPLTRREADQVRRGRVVSRLVREDPLRYWEVVAPITFDTAVAGAVAAKFSLGRADAVAARTQRWGLALTAASVLLTGVLMGAAVQLVVTRPLRRFFAAIRAARAGDTATVVDVHSSDELGLLARHFNEMMARINDFNDELQRRVKEATHEAEGRYREVERLNELLFATQRSLSHAERLALSGRIMAEVAHEVGTPLHSIAGHLDLLRHDLPPALASETVQRRLDIVGDQLARVTGIIAQLIDLTRREPGPASPVDLNRLVGDTAELVRPGLAQAGLTVDLTADPALPPVVGRAPQLQQVILNLLTNAMDATPPGGHIRVTTGRRGAELEVVVSDTGRGIPLAEQTRIFEPFFTTKGDGRGSGLGLFISQQIVREHHGRIEVTSDEGRGATFRVLLPAAA